MGPGVNDRLRIEVLHGGHEPVLKLLLGCDAEMSQDGPRQLGEEAFDQVQPGAMLRGEGELEPAGRLRGDPSAGFLGDVRRMIVEDQVDRCIGRVGRVEQGKELNEFTAAVTILDEAMNLAGEKIDAGQQADRAVTLVFMIAAEGYMYAKSGAVVAIAWIPGFSS